MKSGKFSVSARLRSFRYAFRGFMWLIRDEHNFRIHLAITVLVIPVCFVLKLDRTEWALIILCIALVLAMEGINSAIERLADKLAPGHDPIIGKVKDVSAAAVLVCAIGTAAVGLIILVPKIILLFTL